MGALGKSENVSPPSVVSNNNRDTFPPEINTLIERAYGHTRGTKSNVRQKSLCRVAQQDLRITLKYPPTHTKLKQYLSFFHETGRMGPQASQELQAHVEGDVIWDTVKEVKDAGVRTCVDFTVDTHHNFVLDGIVTHNSTSLANFLLTEGISAPQFRSLFVSPSKEQTTRFSNTRFAKALFFSPFLRRHFVTTEMPANNVMLRMLANGSEFFFSYALDDAERVRGISADRVCYDEVQSIILEAVEPVIRECLAASAYKYRMYCGTPLSAENDIEVMLWQKSSQCEWVVQCRGCGAHNILGLKNIGPKYLICARCEKGPLDVRLGAWRGTKQDHDMLGFRIPQLALHRNVQEGVAYKALLQKLKDYSRAKFNNEVLGVSDSIGARLISLDMLKGLCREYTWWPDSVNPDSMKGVTTVVAGVDWSGQSPTNLSRTALCIWGVLWDGRLRLLYAKTYNVGHAIQDLEDIARLCHLYNVRMIIGDSGEGMLANAELRQKLGSHAVFGNRYGGTDGKIRWNANQNDPGYNSDKTMMVDQIMHGVISRQFELPAWEQFKPYTDDIMAEYEETTPHGRRIWKHAATRPDDFLHAMVFGWLSAKVVTGTVAMYQSEIPEKDPD